MEQEPKKETASELIIDIQESVDSIGDIISGTTIGGRPEDIKQIVDEIQSVNEKLAKLKQLVPSETES